MQKLVEAMAGNAVFSICDMVCNGEPAMYTLLNGYTTDVQNHDWQVT